MLLLQSMSQPRLPLPRLHFQPQHQLHTLRVNIYLLIRNTKLLTYKMSLGCHHNLDRAIRYHLSNHSLSISSSGHNKYHSKYNSSSNP